MALSVQNKNFLAVLNKLDIDMKQFPDITFDGLFDNIPEDVNDFFNWFIENISPDNALTQLEQAIYFQLESSQSLPTDEEIDYVLSSWSPGYEKLKYLDVNYINNFLPQDLNDLKKYYKDATEVLCSLETSYDDIIKKKNNRKEEINTKKKRFNALKEDYHCVNSCFASEVDEVKVFLLKQLQLTLNLDLYNDLLNKSSHMYNKLKNSRYLGGDVFNCSNLDFISKFEEDLVYVESALVLSEGFLKEKKSKLDCLEELLQKKASQKNCNNYNLIVPYATNSKGIDTKINDEVTFLENELFGIKKKLSHDEVQKISDSYLLNKIELQKFCVDKLRQCKEYIRSNQKWKSCLLHILLKCIDSLENISELRKELHSTINKYNTNFINDITNLEMQRQRFKEVAQNQNQHPLLVALSNVISLKESPEDNRESLKNVIEQLTHANDDCNFIEPEFKNDLQSFIKSFSVETLCGPTNQLLFVPVDLLIKFQDCEEGVKNLSQVIQRLASKYVDAKETISKTDRKKLLLWIDFLINPQALEMWLWRRMEKISRMDKVRNEEVLERVGEERSLLRNIEKRKRNWIGHCLRGTENLVRETLEGTVEGKRGRGRQESQRRQDKTKMASA